MLVGATRNALRQVSHDPRLNRDHAAQLVTAFCYAAVKGLDRQLIDKHTLVPARQDARTEDLGQRASRRRKPGQDAARRTGILNW